jgi:hypothetical protein
MKKLTTKEGNARCPIGLDDEPAIHQIPGIGQPARIGHTAVQRDA